MRNISTTIGGCMGSLVARRIFLAAAVMGLTIASTSHPGQAATRATKVGDRIQSTSSNGLLDQAKVDVALTAETTSESFDQDVSNVIAQLNQSFPQSVIIPGYQTLAEATAVLATTSETYAQSPDESTLEALNEAWLEAASAWAAISTFAFGPAHSLGYGKSFEFPIDEAGIDVLLSTGALADAQSLSDVEAVSLHPSLRGLDAIAYLTGQTPPAETTLQTRLYIQHLAQTAAADAEGLLSVWQTGYSEQAPYAQAIATAGDVDNLFYITPQAGSEEIVRSLVNALDVINNESLPELAELPSLAEEQLTLQLLYSQVAGMQQAYVGPEDAGESGLQALALAIDPAMDSQVLAAFDIATTELAKSTDASTRESDDINLTAVADALINIQSSIESGVLQRL